MSDTTEMTEGMRGPDGLEFLDVYNVRGEVQTVPAHWMDDPVISQQFTRQPPTAADVPSKSWNRDQLVEHATARGLEVPDEATKAQILDALDAGAFTTPDPVA